LADSDKIAFAMGCLAFRHDQAPPFKLAWKDYLKNLEAGLSAIPNLEDLKITYLRPTWESLNLTSVEKPMREGGDLFPPLDQTGLSVRFRLHIPRRLHESLSHGWVSNDASEDYLVISSVDFYGPSAVVVPETFTTDPSHGVVLVREFLSQELSRSELPIRLDYLGPTPFHSDCFMEGADSIGSQLRSQVKHRTGYDERTYQFDSDIYPDARTAMDNLLQDLLPELSLYYSLVLGDRQLFHRWQALQGKASSLSELVKQSGWVGLWNRMRKTSRGIADLSIDLAEFEASVVFSSSAFAQSCDEFYTGDGLYSIQSEIEHLRSQTSPMPTDPMSRIVELAESRHSRRVEAASLALASVLGGAVGSLITISVH
jgi:hypothetical protein